MLTKSRLAAWRQCPKRLWLELHEPLPREAGTPNRARGTSVGEMARRLLSPSGGETLDHRDESGPGAVARTAELLAQGRTVFEGAFGDTALLTRADVARATAAGWDLVEVKSSGSVKDHHIEDAAIQTAAARRSGSSPGRVVVAHLDTGWVYPGDEDYGGLFIEADVTEAAMTLADEVEAWIVPAQATALAPTAPIRGTGRHCSDPHACGYINRCRAEEPAVERPLDWLPGPLRREAKALRDAGARSMDDVPDALLSDLQQRVKTQTRLNQEYFDQAGAAADLAGVTGPFCFLDFETVNPPVPLWAGTRPFAQVPFQFSLHVLTEDGTLEHREFLVATGADPSRPFAEALIEALHGEGFEVAVETNGTIAPPPGIDWLCVSPKTAPPFATTRGDELKLVYPHPTLSPADVEHLAFDHLLLQPLDGPGGDGNTAAAVDYCMANQAWRLTLQTHKHLGIR